MPEMVINGINIETGDHKTVLEVCRGAGIAIPTLCNHPALEAYGACRLCVVEIIAGGKPGLAASCVLPAVGGLSIDTASPRVLRARKMIVQLLLGICPQAEVLQNLAAELGIDQRVFPSKEDKNCVLCGLCVRACKTIGNKALGFAFRGPERKVGVPFDEQSEECIGCQACVNVCPVNNIKSEQRNDKLIIKNWSSELTLQKCAACGQYFAPTPYVEKLNRQYSNKEFRVELCDHCKQAHFAAQLLK